jgi:hypothetical protein
VGGDNSEFRDQKPECRIAETDSHHKNTRHKEVPDPEHLRHLRNLRLVLSALCVPSTPCGCATAETSRTGLGALGGSLVNSAIGSWGGGRKWQAAQQQCMIAYALSASERQE